MSSEGRQADTRSRDSRRLFAGIASSLSGRISAPPDLTNSLFDCPSVSLTILRSHWPMLIRPALAIDGREPASHRRPEE